MVARPAREAVSATLAGRSLEVVEATAAGCVTIGSAALSATLAPEPETAVEEEEEEVETLLAKISRLVRNERGERWGRRRSVWPRPVRERACRRMGRGELY